MKSRVLFVSVHLGPYLTLAPLEAEWGGQRCLFLVDGPSCQSRQQAALPYWTLDRVHDSYGSLPAFVRDMGIGAILCGASDGLGDGNLEYAARGAATVCDIPVFVIEDFPGNYRACPGTRLDGLFVEHGSWKQTYDALGVPPDRIHGLGNPRYDHLRLVKRDQLRRATRARLELGREPVVFWAGQPDGGNSFATLERILPSLKVHQLEFLYKAHPRDERYRTGAYQPLLSQLKSWRDITAWSETEGICCAADLVVTQFSSVGVEASYLGIPALFALFDDLGMAYLRDHKGYDVVPWAREECAFLLRSSDSIAERLATALFDDGRRADTRRRFHSRYGSQPLSAPAIASVVNQSVSGVHG